MIKNLSRHTILAGKERLLWTHFQKARGLMFTSRDAVLDTGHVFLFDSSVYASLHMLFVFYPIDVLFLDEEKKVVEMKKRFLPFTFFFPKKRAKFIIELSSGSIKDSGTVLGDRIDWI